MKYWQPVTNEDPTYGVMPHGQLDPADLDAQELSRARGALAYLKSKIGNDGMRRLLAEDIKETTQRTSDWAAASGGWATANLKLITPGPDAAAFHGFFMSMMQNDRQFDLRGAHPDHFMNLPLGATAEVIENVGEDDLPWFIKLEFTGDADRFPVAWDPAYPHRLGAIIFNADEIQIGSAMHELRDTPDGTEISLTISFGDAFPVNYLEGHLRHFAVEWRNWTRLARHELTDG